MSGLPDAWAVGLFLILLAVGFVALAAWGVLLRSEAIRLERAHPDWAGTLRRRSSRKLARLALVSELQTALASGEEIPESVRTDPVFDRFMRRERRLRGVFVPLSLTAFAVYVLG